MAIQKGALKINSYRLWSVMPVTSLSTPRLLQYQPTRNRAQLTVPPRGGSPGFVKILNKSCIILPDSKGNNRLDSLVNIIDTGYIGCLFLIPGIDETLRVNGLARISTSAEHLDLFSDSRNPPRTCIEITIKEVFLHCAKALMRSELWSPKSKIDRSDFPTMGAMINDQLSIIDDPETQEDMVARYKRDL
ncbi:MAG: pyridoxamine 5'-phosphate oxidase family protein [Reinekea sp.]